MISLIVLLNVILSGISFVTWKNSNFESTEMLIIFICLILNVFLCIKFGLIDDRSKRNEEEIKRLKEKLNLPDSVSKNKDNQNQQGEDNK